AHVENLRLVRGQYFTLVAHPKPIDIALTLSPDSVTQRAAVSQALATFFDATRAQTRLRPGLPANPFVLPRAWISEVISATPGEHSHALAGPEIDIICQPGELPVLGTIDWGD